MNRFLFLLFASCFIGPMKSIAFKKQNNLSSFLTAEFLPIKHCYYFAIGKWNTYIFFFLYIGRRMQEVWLRYLFLMQLFPTAKEMYSVENLPFNKKHVFMLVYTSN